MFDRGSPALSPRGVEGTCNPPLPGAAVTLVALGAAIAGGRWPPLTSGYRAAPRSTDTAEVPGRDVRLSLALPPINRVIPYGFRIPGSWRLDPRPSCCASAGAATIEEANLVLARCPPCDTWGIASGPACRIDVFAMAEPPVAADDALLSAAIAEATRACRHPARRPR